VAEIRFCSNNSSGFVLPPTAAKLEAICKFTIVWHIAGSNQFVNLDHGRGKGLPEAAAN